MKTFLANTLLLLAFAGPTTHAQRTQHPVAARMMKKLAAFNALQSTVQSSAKTTAIKQRLLMHVSDTASFNSAGDTTRYFYSLPTRGANHNPRNIESYNDYWYPANAIDGFPFASTPDMPIKPDSTIFRYGQYGAPQKNAYAYNNADRPLSMVGRAGGDTVERFEVVYDALGRQTQGRVYQANALGDPANLVIAYFSTYDAAGRQVKDSSYQPPINLSITLKHAYGANGQLTSTTSTIYQGGSQDSGIRYLFSYTSGGLMRKRTYQEHDGAAWQTFAYDSVAYAGNPATTTYFESAYDMAGNGVLEFETQAYFSLNSAGLWDMLRLYFYDIDIDTMVPGEQIAFSYNSYNNYDTQIFSYDDDGDGAFDATPSYKTRYFYELFNDLSVTDPGASARITLSPNPAGDWLRIEWKNGAAPHSFTLTDAGGRTVRAGAVPAQRSGVDLSALPAGLYIFTAVDAAGAVLHREKVVRQ